MAGKGSSDRGRGHIVVEFSFTLEYEFEYRTRRGVLDTTLNNKVCQWLAAGRWGSPSTPGFSTIKTNRHEITKILLKVDLNTISLNQ